MLLVVSFSLFSPDWLLSGLPHSGAEPMVVDWCPDHGVPFLLHLVDYFLDFYFASRVVSLGFPSPLDAVSFTVGLSTDWLPLFPLSESFFTLVLKQKCV